MPLEFAAAVVPGSASAWFESHVAPPDYAPWTRWTAQPPGTGTREPVMHIDIPAAYVAVAVVAFVLTAALFFAILWHQQGPL